MRTLNQNVANAFFAFLFLLCLVVRAGTPSPDSGFERSAGRLYGKLQLLRQLDRTLVADGANAGKQAFHLRRWREVRQGVDELTAIAATTASGAREQERLRALSVMTTSADARFEEVRRLRPGVAASL